MTLLPSAADVVIPLAAAPRPSSPAPRWCTRSGATTSASTASTASATTSASAVAHDGWWLGKRCGRAAGRSGGYEGGVPGLLRPQPCAMQPSIEARPIRVVAVAAPQRSLALRHWRQKRRPDRWLWQRLSGMPGAKPRLRSALCTPSMAMQRAGTRLCTVGGPCRSNYHRSSRRRRCGTPHPAGHGWDLGHSSRCGEYRLVGPISAAQRRRLKCRRS